MLRSQLFTADPRLQACVVQDSAHVQKGDQGIFVSKIQIALFLLDGFLPALPELGNAIYGSSTAAGVLRYKSKRGIINRSYQSSPDDIVGRMTIACMDEDLRIRDSRLAALYPYLNMLDAFDTAPAYLFWKDLILATGHSPGGAENATRFGIAPGGQGSAAVEIFPIFANGSVKPPLRTTVRARIVEKARAFGDQYSNKTWSQGAKDCWPVFREATGKSGQPTPASITPLNWCGIFATYVWHEATGTDVVFRRTLGISRTASLGGRIAKDYIAPGDILVEEWEHRSTDGTTTNPHHHVLIMEIFPRNGTAMVLEGNAGNGRNQDETIVQIRNNYPLYEAIDKKVNFYSVDTLRNPAVVYTKRQ